MYNIYKLNYNESGDNMKKIKNIFLVIVSMVLVLSLVSCKKKDSDKINPPKNSTGTIDDSDKTEKDKAAIMKDFDNVLKTNDLSKVIGFIDDNIKSLSQIEGDKMVLDLEVVLEESLNPTMDNIFKADPNGELINIAESDIFFPKEKIKDIESETLKNEVTKLMENKYKLINLEGSFYPIIDYENLKQYNNYVSDEIKEYIEIKAIDSNSPVVIDAGLLISYDDLASRILKVENYIQRYSQGQKHEEILRLYRSKLALYLGGVDNTPIFVNDTKKIKDDVLESYKKTSNTKDSVTAHIVNKYVNLIEKNDLIINTVVQDEVVSLVNEALSILEVSK
jgi:hypothetical protein